MSQFVKRIGIFGGTFNPIHMGHLRTVWEVHCGFGLDETILIPSAAPPHKPAEGVIDAGDRLEMVRLAISGYDEFTVSDVELKRPGPSYTIDTVRHFKSVYPEDADFHLIIGLDAILEIDTWKSYRDIFRLIPFIVMMRGPISCR